MLIISEVRLGVETMSCVVILLEVGNGVVAVREGADVTDGVTGSVGMVTLEVTASVVAIAIVVSVGVVPYR